MTHAHDNHAAAPPDTGEDRSSIEYAIRSELPSDPVERGEQSAVLRLTGFLGWLLQLGGIVAGVGFLWCDYYEPSFFKYFSSVMMVLTGVLWGWAARSVSESGRGVITHSTS